MTWMPIEEAPVWTPPRVVVALLVAAVFVGIIAMSIWIGRVMTTYPCDGCSASKDP